MNTWKADRLIHLSKTDTTAKLQLRNAWDAFAKAILANDTVAIKILSTDSITCFNCFFNTHSKDSLFKLYEVRNPDWASKPDANLFLLPTDRFLKENMSIIFDSEIRSRLLDKSKLVFIDDVHNKNLYEVLVTSLDPSPKFEGAQVSFGFILTKKGFKFCGYDTIP